jgi:hypothetical protein
LATSDERLGDIEREVGLAGARCADDGEDHG